MRVYVAGPLSAETEEGVRENVRRAEEAAARLIALGHNVYCPHLSYYLDRRSRTLGYPVAYERWMKMDFEWLGLCDAILYLGSSPGADRELFEALRLGLKLVENWHEMEWEEEGL